jgi:hypothetical protein
VITLLLAVAIGIIYSISVAPGLNQAKASDHVTEAVERAIWAPTGTQVSVDGNIIWAVSNGESGPATYVGDSIEQLYKFKEWEVKEAGKDLEKWRKKAGEPTAILTYVCRQNGINSKDCPVTLYAMAQHESYFGKAMSGDGGRSQGYFHILDIHKLPKSCTHDLECSADFTLKRMIRYGYKTNPANAIMAHNGTPGIPATTRYLASVNAKKALYPN